MFNLEEFMCNEFLRPKENSCKWFNNLGVMRMGVYIVKKGKCKILNKTTAWINSTNEWIDSNHYMTNWEDQESYEVWCTSEYVWIDSNCPGWRLIWFKIWWIDSGKVRDILWYDSLNIETTQSESIQTSMKRFKLCSKLFGVDSSIFESIHAEETKDLADDT
jgi:hypothetical protein